MKWQGKFLGPRCFRDCGAGCGARLRVDPVAAMPDSAVPTGPWFCRDADCRARRDQLATPKLGGFADALRSVAREVVATGLADDLILVPGRRTRYFTAAGDDIEIDDDLVRQVRDSVDSSRDAEDAPVAADEPATA